LEVTALASMDPTCAPVVQTSSGPIRGLRGEDGGSVFKGVPFAAPPVGPLRWRRPQPHVPWGPAPRDCTDFGPCALQSSRIAVQGGIDESCLHLNIWMPEGADVMSTKLPVFVWIHGGAYIYGSGSESQYDGAKLASQGLVVVSINYRLGIFGFFRPEGDADYNCGLWDQVEALRWIHGNIANFAGDPANATVCGQSSGGLSVIYLVASPVANKLFRRAIAMSSNAYHCTDAERAGAVLELVARAATGASSAAAEEMRAMRAEDLLATQLGERILDPAIPGEYQKYRELEPMTFMRQAALLQSKEMPLSFFGGAVVDGELLPQLPLDLLAAGTAAHIDLLVGSNKEEIAFPGRSAPDTVEDGVARLATELVGLRSLVSPVTRAQSLFEGYFSAERGGGMAQAGTVQHAWDRLCSDMIFGASTVMVAARQHQHNPGGTFVYRYEGESGRNSYHTRELPLVLGNLPSDEPPGRLHLGEKMLGAWANFARTGDPNGTPGVPPWAPWGAAGTDGVVMLFDEAGCATGSYVDVAPAIGKVIEHIDDAYPHSSKGLQ